MTGTEFEYSRRLASGEIRLLSFQPSSNPSAPLSFNLVTTSLDSPSPYLALSYVWGAPTSLTPITIDSQPFSITPNLHSALVHLVPEISFLPIWVDAVCINQHDDVEKTAQIIRMSDVYQSAVKVIAYLGPSDPVTDLAVEQMSRIGEQVYNSGAMLLREADMCQWPHFSHLSDRPAERQKRLDLREFLEGLMDDEAGDETTPPRIPTDAAVAMLSRPWFARAWVIQELVMAPEGDGGCVFAVGTKRISWEHLWGSTFFLALWFMKEVRQVGAAETEEECVQRFKRYQMRVGSSDSGFSSRAPQTIGVRKKYLQGDLNRSLRALLMNLYTGDSAEPLGCRDPEDKIRALRSLAEHGVFLDGIMVPGASWQEIYTSLARHFYRQGQLDFLGLCRQRQSSLPSWVTDWRQHHRPPWLGYKTGDAAQLFDAGKGTAPKVHENKSNDKVLCLEGWFIDAIQDVGTVWTAALDEDFNWQSATIRVHDIYHFVARSPKYPGREQQDEARWRIIVADKESNEVSQQARATEKSKDHHKRLLYATMTYPQGQGSFGTWFPPYRNTLLTLWGSRPFLSATGYVGLCPDTVEPGDGIFIPSGSHCPYVIRKHHVTPEQGLEKQTEEETWTLLGEAYVHGIMDGELDLGNKTIESRQFHIV